MKLGAIRVSQGHVSLAPGPYLGNGESNSMKIETDYNGAVLSKKDALYLIEQIRKFWGIGNEIKNPTP